MANFDSVVTSQNQAFSTIQGIATDAMDSLKAISLALNVDSPSFPIDSLDYDPGQPDKIVIDTGSVKIEKIISDIDGWIKKLSNVKSPEFPDAPSQGMLNHEVWDEVFMNDMKDNLNKYIQTMGIPDKIYQDSIFNEEYERNLQTLNDLFELADAKLGARGFSYTNDYGNSLKIDAQQKYQFDNMAIV